MSLTLELGSLEYVRVPVTALGLDLSADAVDMAFTNGSHPATGDWHAASWDSGEARILVGPGGAVTLPVGGWQIWVRVTDSPEIPVLRAGLLTVR